MDFSIVVPCYNQGSYLDDCLNSIFQQTFENWECLIIDDGSNDNSKIIANKWCRQDSRFNYLHQNNQGLSAARNKGLILASGDFIQFLDADDLIEENKLKICFDLIKSHSLDGIVSNFVTLDYNFQLTPPFCDLKAEYLDYESILLDWDSKFSIPIHCGLFKKDLFEDFSFPVSLKAKEDWIMWIYLFQNKPKFEFVDKPLAIYRKNSQGMTKDWARMLRERLKALLYLENLVDNENFIILIKELAIQNTEALIKIRKSYFNLKNSRSNKIMEVLKSTPLQSIYNWFKN